MITGLLVFAYASQKTSLVGRTPLDDPPAVLVNRAEEIITSLGYTDPLGEYASGFLAFADYRQWLRSQALGPGRWDVLSSGSPSAILFWYRSSLRELIPIDEDTISLTIHRRSKPACARSSSIRVAGCSDSARCRRSSMSASGTAPQPQWNTLFEAAGLSMSSFAEATPQWAPPDYADTRAAWTGPHPTLADVTLRVEGAAYRGKPVFFDVIGPWTDPERMQPDQESSRDQVFVH